MFSLEDVNGMTRAQFVGHFGDVAEHSPWVAEAAYRSTPYSCRDALITAFAAAVQDAAHPAQLDLICAHPDLAGKAARAGEMAEDSKREQAGAGLDQLTETEFLSFQELNAAYKERFGFPFIFAVKGATKHMILSAFEDRIQNSMDEEFAMALSQVLRIFRFRLEDRVADSNATQEI